MKVDVRSMVIMDSIKNRKVAGIKKIGAGRRASIIAVDGCLSLGIPGQMKMAVRVSKTPSLTKNVTSLGVREHDSGGVFSKAVGCWLFARIGCKELKNGRMEEWKNPRLVGKSSVLPFPTSCSRTYMLL